MKVVKKYPIGESIPDEAIYLQTIYKREDGTNIPYMVFLVNDNEKKK